MEGSSATVRKVMTIRDLGRLIEDVMTPFRAGVVVFCFCFLVVLLGLLLIKMSIPG